MRRTTAAALSGLAVSEKSGTVGQKPRRVKVNVRTRIKYQGKEYSSVEELPPEARSAYEKAMAAGDATTSSKIVFNGQEYASPEQMPPSERQLYEDAIKLAGESGRMAPKNTAPGLLTARQWQLVLLFAVLVLVVVGALLLKR